jgi:hypothetical protein
MAKKQKPLLQEGTVRRMMKLANMDALGDGFISEKYTMLQERDPYGGEGGDETAAERKGGRGPGPKDRGDEPQKKHAFGKRLEEQDEEMGLEAEEEVDVEEFPPEEEGGEELEGEVTITDEEAQDIIALADKLKDAVEGGGEELEMGAEEEIEGGGEELEMGAEEEIGMEEPGNRSMYEEELYEAALKGLNIDFVDDKKAKHQAMLKEVKGRVYKRVIDRLLKQRKK